MLCMMSFGVALLLFHKGWRKSGSSDPNKISHVSWFLLNACKCFIFPIESYGVSDSPCDSLVLCLSEVYIVEGATHQHQHITLRYYVIH